MTCMLQALEQSMLAELLAPTATTAMFAWYNFVGYLATALGLAEAGRLVDFLQLSSTGHLLKVTVLCSSNTALCVVQ